MDNLLTPRSSSGNLVRLLVCVALWLAIPARAALLAYEGFNYPAGTDLTNISPVSVGDSFGWADPWHASIRSFATNVAGSLGYSDGHGHSLVTDGGSMIAAGPTVANSGNAQPSRSFQIGTLGGPLNNIYSGFSSGTYWFSFLAQWIGPTNSTLPFYQRKGAVQFRAGHATNDISLPPDAELIAVGRPNFAQFGGTPFDTWTIWNGTDPGATGSSVPTSYPLHGASGASFILIRFDVDDSTNTVDTTYLWVNWTNLSVMPDVSLANATNHFNLTGINNIRIDANGAGSGSSNAIVQFDEIRLGATFADVTPYVSDAYLEFQLLENQLVLSWTNTGFVLQAAPVLPGPFTNLPAATSPYTNSLTGLQQFFRLKAQ